MAFERSPSGQCLDGAMLGKEGRMFDFHLHSGLSHDSTADAAEMVVAAEQLGLREICFTDHYDSETDRPDVPSHLFTMEDYARTYDALNSDRLRIRRGVEFTLTPENAPLLDVLLHKRPFDFVIGSVHAVRGIGPYNPKFWEGRSVRESFTAHLEHTLACVRQHTAFDVLGHLNYVCKAPYNPTKEPLLYADYRDLVEEILKALVANGKGLEVNTSGVDSVGCLLPSEPFVRRFRELGGEIVTVGSDAHSPARVGAHMDAALELLRSIFGYVCTFEERRPQFHKL